MKLNNLKILVNGRVIRDIAFQSGLNLITNERDYGRSGNSVGKSTLSRVIDFLFLGSIKPIYIDEEFKKPNATIETLFQNERVEAQLSFIGLDNNLHVISRNLSIQSSKNLFYVDGEEVDEGKYEASLQLLLFDVSTKRPSVRFIAPKFIRNSSFRMLNTIKFLDPHTRPGSKDYSELFLYLFGFQNTALLTKKREASNLAARKKKITTSLNILVRDQKPAAEILKYQNQVQRLEKDFLKFEYSPKISNPVQRLSELQIEENILVESILEIDRKISNIKRTVELLSRQGGNYLVNEVRAIYDFAGVNIEKAIRKYEEVLSFHDGLVLKKEQFLTIDLPELNSKFEELKEDLENTRQNKMSIFSEMRSEESIAQITKNLKDLGDLKVKVGKLTGVLEQQENAVSEQRRAEEALDSILKEISKELSLFFQFEKAFNKHFKRLTNLTHGEQYEFSLEFDEESGICNVDVKNTVSNPEGGKKKAEVIAFDMAYICASHELSIRRPNFVFHDSIEDIDQKQIETIFLASRSLPGQHFVSMLSDKLTPEMYLKYLPDVVLLLSEDDMFFRV